MANKCPDCNGAGQYSLPEAAWRPGDDGWYKCERCGGSGKRKIDRERRQAADDSRAQPKEI
jgi:DnaJ-class molecular chaperone